MQNCERAESTCICVRVYERRGYCFAVVLKERNNKAYYKLVQNVLRNGC